MSRISDHAGKQRLRQLSAPPHALGKILSASLSDQLRERYKVRSLSVRKGDTVKIVRGDFAGIEGKITDVDRGARRIYVEGVTRERVSGQQSKIGVHPSKVMITNLNLSDRWRTESVEGRGQGVAKSEKGEVKQ